MQQRSIMRICILVFLILVSFLNSGCGKGGDDESSSTPPPSKNYYMVAGTARGLIGTGLVLQNNETDDLVIDENGWFNFSKSIEEGSSCTVTILSQPTNPDQVCQVLNGSQVANGDSITDVEIRCEYGFIESFNSEINPDNWKSAAEYERSVVTGEMEYNLVTKSDYALNYLSFKDETCGSVSVDVSITDTEIIGTGIAKYTTVLESCGYHTSTAGEADGRRTGDVFAAVFIEGTQSPFQAYYQVYRCLNEQCENSEDIELLTPGTKGYVQFGEVGLNTLASILIDWDSLTPGQFSFQLNSDPVVNFDPVAAGAAIDSILANAPRKYMGIKTDLSNPDDMASMTATFDKVKVNGLPYDDFDNVSYLDGSLWGRTNGKVAIDSGRLLIETGKEYVGDQYTDDIFHSIDLSSNKLIIPNAEIVEADIELDSSTFVIDNGENLAEAHGLIEVEYRPAGVENTNYKNSFYVQAGIKEIPAGVVAQMRAFSCADSNCSGKQIDETQVFTMSVAKDVAHHFRVENVGNGLLNIVLDNAETLSFDMSGIPDFALMEFTRIMLRTMVRGTDTPGEEAFARAYFDNVQMASP